MLSRQKMSEFGSGVWAVGGVLRFSRLFTLYFDRFCNRLDAFSNSTTRSMQAKYQLIWAIRLARAMGVVRKLTSHLIFGGNL